MRAIIIVLDSLGVGYLPDANKYGDEGANTLGHIYDSVDKLRMKNLINMGIGNIDWSDFEAERKLPQIKNPIACYGKMREVSAGKDTTTGHWEIAGLKTTIPFKTYPNGFPEEFIKAFEERIGIEVLGNYPASGTEIIEQLGKEHEETGKPIVYTSADSVFQIAMDVDLFGLDTLYKYCEIAREMLVGDWACGRVIARPYIKTRELDANGTTITKRVRTSDRRDYSVTPPSETMLNKILNNGKKVYAIGKINDIFNGYGISDSVHTVDNNDGIKITIETLKSDIDDCLIFTNLVDFDSKYGHRRNIEGYANAIQEFDNAIPDILNAMRDDDLLFITADHGNDPTWTGTDHTREYVPLIVYGNNIKNNVDLGIRETFSDIAATICDYLNVESTGFGSSFLRKVKIMNKDFNMVDIIQKKRDKQVLSREEIEFWINEYSNDNIPDYQSSALLMAIYLNGLNKDEIFYLTNAMRYSGEVIDLSAIDGTKVDKHSTGGVGDKTTLVVAPIVASCGVPVAKMSGRGLGFSGGTLDKLDSIPGMKTDLSSEEFTNQVNNIGIAVIGQTSDIVPADKKLYALRDVTATIDNLGLIASSIMSKKLAAGSDAIILDVKCGSGAFMKDENAARELANLMVNIGESAGKPTVACITNMDQPLGNAVGNSLEVFEAIETLKGRGPEDFTTLTATLAGIMLCLGGVAETREDGYDMAITAIESGAALEKFREFIEAQGGNSQIIDDYSLLPKAKYVANVAAHKSGWIKSINAEKIGIASQKAGAGRIEKDDVIDLTAGILFKRRVGEYIDQNDIICTVCGEDKEKVKEAAKLVKEAFDITDVLVEKPVVIKDIIY